ncbi:hypothetical protein HMPREF0322_04574 [Desulfitobacterium hafniense DP7]|nr:hypothetical protein HMPREF0322_04574 [Desulfitobacterium hafniense DP7]
MVWGCVVHHGLIEGNKIGTDFRCFQPLAGGGSRIKVIHEFPEVFAGVSFAKSLQIKMSHKVAVQVEMIVEFFIDKSGVLFIDDFLKIGKDFLLLFLRHSVHRIPPDSTIP